MSRPELRSRLFSAAVTIGAVAGVLWFGLEGRRPAPAAAWSQIEVGGKVTDALSGRPVPYALPVLGRILGLVSEAETQYLHHV